MENYYVQFGNVLLDEKNILISMTGVVLDCLANGDFYVELDNGVQIVAHVSGKIRRNLIKILVGDVVILEICPYDLTRGRIVYRYKPKRKKELTPIACATR